MYTFAEAARLSPLLVGREAARLAAQTSLLAPGFVIDRLFEEDFYTSNNLPEQLRNLFSPINPRRIDEDALEPLCDKAQTLVRASYLLDDAVQKFYRAVRNADVLGGKVHVRRDGEPTGEVATAFAPGTEALVALKKLWVSDWTFEAVLARLDEAGSVGLEARPALMFAGGPGQLDAEVAAKLGVGHALMNERGLVGLS
ncbi:hypothetical protein [Deinococcus yavapaiensis]|uniref:Uncharacterized protein n=1 Tax=Deinococcus yavapaiensis KR-236 TaxID=694435 RepID=A0A318S3P0_9DEIO|nr:hypothetical protein [Deinococcus yavapaiensis]PYE53019.1 hypothetical protein DES52_1102 [Deinococcus yavapaiensis KR-236]